MIHMYIFNTTYILCFLSVCFWLGGIHIFRNSGGSIFLFKDSEELGLKEEGLTNSGGGKRLSATL